ncbi:MAG: magnesium transporter MgtE [Anaerolineae bacterium CG_4_9_14_0_8_um_filter_58_9]|nr:MAG: magnesium transporter MgtE [Anaerolineae bacterium CG_4_9_14_0_8_um_filter_58_9]
MAFLSEMLGRPVTDIDGKLIGTLKDVIAKQMQEFPHPLIQAILVSRKGETLTVNYSAVASLMSPVITLMKRVEDLRPYLGHEEDIFLSRDVLDKQIIDTDGARVVRVNDVELMRVNGTIYVGNVDIGAAGILRRVGLARAARWLKLRPNPISWNNAELLRRDQSMRLRVPVEKIHELHPADVAEILSDLNKLESGQFLAALDVEHLADALEEIEPKFQASLIESMPDEKVADVLEEMEPDEAADLLADLPKERKEDLLALMEKDEAEDVRKLLAYPEDSAGGIMTTEYAAISPNLTAAGAIKALRGMADEVETMFYVYVTDEEDHLLGVFSLNNLIFASPGAMVKDFMAERVITVNLTDDQETVAQTVAKYDLLAVPVVDEQNRLHGIVTADDALDKFIPTAWKKQLPRFYH